MRNFLICTFLLGFMSVANAQIDKQSEKVKNEMVVVAEADMDHEHHAPPDSSLHPKIQRGIVPVPIIITEPALGGFGGGLALGYIHSNRHSIRENTPPTISGIAGGYTANGTWFAGLGHSHSFVNDHIRYMGGVAVADVNIAFYFDTFLGSLPVNVIMDSWGTVQKLLFRMKESNIFLGPSYVFVNSKIRLNEDTGHPLFDSLINSIEKTSRLGMLGLEFNYDSRDNFLSPDKGLYIGGKYHFNATFFGGDEDFGKTEIYGKVYFPVGKQVFGAFRFDGQFSGDEAPFYALPYISLRGVPAARYQGNNVTLVETQWRWVFYKGFSVVGFTGTGKAFNEFNQFGDADWIYNYGGGVRFALKKLFDLRVGADAAWSNEDFAWYFSVGSSF